MTTEAVLPSTEDIERMCDLVRGMAVNLVDHPDAIDVESESFDTEVVIRLFVAEDDLEKLTGRQSRTARSLRTILNAAAGRLQHRFILDIEADEEE